VRDEYEHGQFNVICPRCGFKYKARHLRMEWSGIRVCYGAETNGCWEPRHPQDFVKGKPDRQAPPWVAPEAPDEFIEADDPDNLGANL
jgi:hypothetical protein